jgi:PAS domain S-box-containing protein
MKAAAGEGLTSVKQGPFRHPLVIGTAAASLAALLGINIAAFVRGLEAPWLLATVLILDMLVIGMGGLLATREVMHAEQEAARTRGALGEAQARLAAIVDSAMDAVITVDDGQRIVLFNRAAEQVFRIRREDVLGTPLDRLLPQRFRAAHRTHVERFGRTGTTSRRMGDVTTLAGLRVDSGEEFPIEASISQVSEGGRRLFTVILRDITLRKQHEDALQRQQQELRELSARVLEAREEEKTRIARELHDELGQLLTALKMDLSWLRERLPASEGALAARAAEMGAVLDQTVASTRRISADLRPLMLDDLGLAEAAQWLVDDFAHRSGVRCELRLAGAALGALDSRLATTVYRALQESLTNIARHSGAKHAWVSLALEQDGADKGDTLRLEVEDDGCGIAPGDLAKARSLGLKGMRERIAHFGGSLDIARAPRGGTRLRLRIPALAPAEAG